jgi:hypothetical protein
MNHRYRISRPSCVIVTNNRLDRFLQASIVQARCCVSRFDQLRAEAATVLGYDATLANVSGGGGRLRHYAPLLAA